MQKGARFGAVLLLIALLLTFSSSLALADSGSTIVYKTRTGECYHRETCSYLKSCIPITLEEAVASGLRPCSRCKPPELDEGVKVTPKPTPTPKQSAPSRSSSSSGSGTRSAASSGMTKSAPATTKADSDIMGAIGFLFLALFAAGFFIPIIGLLFGLIIDPIRERRKGKK